MKVLVNFTQEIEYQAEIEYDDLIELNGDLTRDAFDLPSKDELEGTDIYFLDVNKTLPSDELASYLMDNSYEIDNGAVHVSDMQRKGK